MPDLSVEGHIIDVPGDAIVTWAVGTMITPLEIVALLHWAQHFAMPGRSIGDFLRVLEKSIAQLRENVGVTEDRHLEHAIQQVLPTLVAATDAASEIREWQNFHVSRLEKATHNKAVNEFGPQDPPWILNETFQAKLSQFSLAFSQYLDALSRVIPSIHGMLTPTTSPSIIDQLHDTSASLPLYQEILRIGYHEAFRRGAAQMGDYPST